MPWDIPFDPSNHLPISPGVDADGRELYIAAILHIIITEDGFLCYPHYTTVFAGGKPKQPFSGPGQLSLDLPYAQAAIFKEYPFYYVLVQKFDLEDGEQLPTWEPCTCDYCTGKADREFE